MNAEFLYDCLLPRSSVWQHVRQIVMTLAHKVLPTPHDVRDQLAVSCHREWATRVNLANKILAMTALVGAHLACANAAHETNTGTTGGFSSAVGSGGWTTPASAGGSTSASASGGSGAVATGGALGAATGGAVATGGALGAATGGAVATGGALGAATGGAVATGGALGAATGGAVATGGASAGGSGTGVFGCDGTPTLGTISPGALNLELSQAPREFLLVNVHIPLAGDIPGTDADLAYTDVAAIEAFIGPDKTKPVVIYCYSDHMALIAGPALVADGYCRVRYLVGGLSAWIAAGYAVIPP